MRLNFIGNAAKVSVSGSSAYLVDRPSKLKVVDVGDPFNPEQISTFALPGHVEGVVVSGDYAFLASGASGMHVVDVSDPSAPMQVAQVETQGYAGAIAMDGNHVCVTTNHGPEGMEVFDVTDPTVPVSVGFVRQRHGPYRDVEISSGIAFIPDERGLSALDISDPAHPFESGWLDLEGFEVRWATAGVDVQGTLAAVAQAGDGTVFVDVSDPSAMLILSRFESTFVWDAELQGSRAYIADVGFRVLDISDPENPVEVGFVSSDGVEGRGVALDATVAYVSYGKVGILAYDVSDPSDPMVVAKYDSLGFSNKAVVQDGLLYLADQEGGLAVLETLSSKKVEVLAPGTRIRSKRQAIRQGSDAWVQTGSEGGRLEYEKSSKYSISRIERRQPSSPGLGLRSFGAQKIQTRSPRPGSGQGRGGTAQLAPAATHGFHKQANTCQVTTTADAGSGSFRWCLEQAQSGDTIVFDPAVFPPDNPATIQVTGFLPPISQGGLTIDGSESGVILDGDNQPIFGLFIESDANAVRGLQIYRFGGAGIWMSGHNNEIGGDRSIGGGPVGQGNVCSGNNFGISVWEGGHNIITGNLIGTDVTGMHAMGNEGYGLYVRGHDNRIGGYGPGTRNVISGNGAGGITLHLNGSVGNWVIGNYVGTDIDGMMALGNGMQGITAEQGAAGNLNDGNVCSGNEMQGILIADAGSSYNSGCWQHRGA